MITLYLKCLMAKYIHTNLGGSYAIQGEGDTLYLMFQWSNGFTDWLFNLLFPKKKRQPYSRMDEPWKCHGGFLRVWESIKPLVHDSIMNPIYKKIIVVGYSHGAAMAVLCHEYVWFNRPDVRGELNGYGFGCPRVFSGNLTDSLAERWYNFKVIRNINDIVTHVPPKIFGFQHVGILYEIGYKGRYNCIDAHRPESYIQELKAGRGLY